MRDAMRCCISCILPCGALDLIRIVHVSGRVEEISAGAVSAVSAGAVSAVSAGAVSAVSAGDIMQAYPKHVLRKPPSLSFEGADEDAPKAVTLPPDSELQRGKIYFLVPVSAPPEAASTAAARMGRRKKKKKEVDQSNVAARRAAAEKSMVLLNERYLSEILSEKASTYRDKRRGRVGVWRPHLDNISEASSEL